MITFNQLLQESTLKFYQYAALVKVTYNKDPEMGLGAERIAEMLRALPGGTRVSTASLDKEHGIGIFNVRLISQKPPKEAFLAFKQNALKRFGDALLKVEVGKGSIEVKNFVN